MGNRSGRANPGQSVGRKAGCADAFTLARRSANRHNLPGVRRLGGATGGTTGMHTILLALGIVVTLAGGAMVGFGISNYGFEIGNALVTSGTTAVVGGLIIVALAALLRELRAARTPDGRAAPRPAVAPP